MNSPRENGGAERDDEDQRPAGIEYHGVAGGSDDCQSTVVRLIQCGVRIARVRILTVRNEHALLLCNEVGDQIAIKSGFTSGYGGTGPTAFSVTLELLNRENAEIDELIVEPAVLERLDASALTVADLSAIADSRPVRPGRWNDYILERHFEAARDGALWRDFPRVMPFSIIDPRIMDLARDFWADPDGRLNRGYRRLEDAVRKRTGIDEIGAKLFSRAFGKTPALGWGTGTAARPKDGLSSSPPSSWPIGILELIRRITGPTNWPNSCC